jgi:hypothetical protein
MNSHTVALAVGMVGIALTACGDAPTDPVAPTELTQLAIEPSTPISDNDPTGMVILTVFGGEATGTVTVEVCADAFGSPMPGDYALDVAACEQASGRWIVAIDNRDRAWDRRSIDGSEILRFGREANQGVLLFRASYEAPDNGRSESVPACPWTLAEGSDLGVRCTSRNEIQLLPGIRSGHGAAAAF